MRFLSVDLENQQYAIDALRVREIQAFTEPNAVPCMPRHLLGVMNLHGAIVPVVDLRLRLGLPRAKNDRLAATIFVELGKRIVGLVVDAALRIVDLPAERIEPAPEIGSELDRSMIAGLAHVNDQIYVLLSLDALLGNDPALSQAAAAH